MIDETLEKQRVSQEARDDRSENNAGRTVPSGAVVWALDVLKKDRMPINHVVDIGSGRGRNTIFMAEKGLNVTSMDFMPSSIEALQNEAKERALEEKIRAFVYDVTEGWPVAAGDFDLAVDTYCFKHIVGREARLSYKENLIRALRDSGFFLISFCSLNDGYYSKHIREKSEDGEEAIAVDPESGAESVLYTRDHIVRYFAPEFKIYDEIFRDEDGDHNGKLYHRQTYALLFRKVLHYVQVG